MIDSGVQLRALTPEDLADTQRWRNDPAVARLSLGRPFPITEANERAWYDSAGVGVTPARADWAIDAGQGIVGVVQLNNIDWVNRTCWFGIFVGPEHQGKGYGTEATRLATRHAFQRLNLRQVRLEVRVDNAAALAVYRRIGFTDEGTKTGAILDGNDAVDLALLMLESSGAKAD